MKPVTVVAAAIIRRGNTILIARRGPTGPIAGLWEFPGGKVKPGETLESCLRREIAEELGAEIAVESAFLPVEHDYGEGSIRLRSFLCRLIRGEPRLLEHAEIRWVAPEEMRAYQFAPADAPIVRRLLSERGKR